MRRWLLWLGLSAALSPSLASAQSAACDPLTEQEVDYQFSATTWTAGDTTDNVTVGTGAGQTTLATAITGGSHQAGSPLIGIRGNDPNSLLIQVDRGSWAASNVITFTFGRAVTKLTVNTSDLDWENGGGQSYRDQFTVTGTDALGAAVTPTAVAANTTQVTAAGNVASANTGTTDCADTSAACDATFSFAATAPTRVVTMTYTNANPQQQANPTVQYVGINKLSFCVPTVGQVRVGKTTSNDVGTFDYTATNLAAAPTVTTTVAGTQANGAFVDFTAPGTAVTLTETVPVGWTHTTTVGTASCRDTNGAVSGNAAATDLESAFNAGTATYTLPLAVTTPGARITCLYTNNKTSPTLQLTKISQGGVGTFNFTGGNGWASQNITTVTAGVGVSGARQALAAAGTPTTITENTLPAGFVLTGISCTGLGAGTATPNLGARTVTLNAAATAVANDISCTFTNQVQADLSLTKGVDNASPLMGSNVVFTITLTNAGPAAATGVTVTDLLPSGYSFVSSSTATGSYASGTGVWNVGTINSGATATLTITATVLTSGVYTNTAQVTASGVFDPDSTPNDGTGDDFASVTPTPTPAANLAISKTNGVSSVNAGGTTSYTVRVTNGGPSSVTGATLVDAVATGLSKTGVTCTAAAGNQCVTPPTVAALEAGFGLPALASGQFYEIAIAANVTATSGSVTNTATVSPPAGTTDPVPANNTISDTDTVNPVADLAIDKSGTSTAAQGATVTYTIVAWNNGPSPVTNAAITDNVPANLTSVSWTCTPSGTATCNSASGTGNAISLTANLPVDPAPTNAANTNFVTITVTATATTTGSITNTASIAPPGGTTDPTPGNSSDGQATTITPSADLAIDKSGTSSAAQGATISYAIVVWNNGPSAVTNAVITDTVPANITGVSWTCTSSGTAACGSPSGSGNAISLTANLPVDPAPTTAANTNFVTINVTGTATTTGSFTNTASVAPPAGTTDPTAGNSSDGQATTITPSADLAIDKSGTATAAQGATVTYTIVAWNNGPSAVTNAVITDNVPASLTGVSWTCTPSGTATCNTASGSGNAISLTANLPVDPAPTTAANTNFVTITVTATATTTGGITNTASIAPPAGTTDPTPGNSSDGQNTNITPSADLAIDKTGTASVGQGGTVTYTIRAWNNGPSDAFAAVITDNVPANLTGVTWTCTPTGTAACGSPSGNGNAISVAVDLPVDTAPTTSGDTNYVTLSVTGTASTVGSFTNTASIAPPGGTTDPTPGNSSDGQPTTINNVVDAVDDSSTTPFNTAVATNVLANDTTTSVPLNPASVSVTSPSPNGTTSVNTTTGAVTFTPNAGFTGVTSYTYQVCDTSAPTPVCDTAVVTVVVGPNAVDDSASTAQNTPLSASVAGNDAFPAGSTFSSVTSPTNGALVFNPDGTYTYTPNANFSGSDSFTYRVCLPAPNGTVCDTATVNIGVGANVVTAVDDTASTPFNTAVTTPVLANDTTGGAPLNPASVTVATPSPDGSTSVNPATGAITFTPNAGFTGVATYTYQVCDTSNPIPVCDSAIVTVAVGPNAVDDSANTAQNTPLNATVAGNDVFPAGATFSSTTSPANGVLVFNPDGSYTYTPNAGFSGSDSFTYQVCLPAPNGAVCDSATVSITVGANTVTANDDASTTPFGTPVTTPVLANDTTTGAALNPASVTVTTPSANGTTSVNPANGDITFTPNAGFTGVATYTYQVCDTSTPTVVCDTAVVTVVVGPNAVDDSYTTPQNTPLSDDVSDNDVHPAGSVFSTTSLPTNGTLVFNPDGTFTYTPNAGFSGSDSFTYQVCLPAPNGAVCDVATVNLGVAVNVVTAADDSSTTPYQMAVVTDVLANDTSGGAPLDPSSVAVTVPSPNGSTSVNPVSGEITFTPNAGFTGVAQYTYEVCDSSNPTPVCDTAVVTVAVGPLANDDSFSTPQNTPLNGDVSGNDDYPAGATFATTSLPTNGTLLFNPDGTFTYTPNAGFSGSDSFTYQVCLPAPNGTVCDSAAVTIGVAVNAISAADDSSTTPFNTPVTTPVLANDTTGGAALDPASVTVTVASPNGTTSVNPANGEITFTPNATFTGVTQYTYEVCDTSTPTPVCDTAVVTVIVGPNAVDDSFSTPQNTPISDTVTANDAFPMGAVFSNTSSPANGTLLFNADGSFTYTPNAGFSGTDSFTYQVCLPAPNGTVCDSATVTIGVAVNAVSAADDSSTTPFNTPVATDVLANDTTGGAPLNPASVTVTVASPNGTTSVNPATGEITFTPNATFTGVTQYTYQVCDTSNPTPVCDDAVVTVIVGPNAVDDTASTAQNVPLNSSVAGNDAFPAGAVFSNTSSPANGTLLFNPDGTFTYTPNAGFSGTDSFTYQACLPAPNGTVCDTATANIGVGINVIVANDDSSTTAFNTPVTTPVLANDTTGGAPLDPASVTVTVASPNGTTSVNPANGEITFTPNATFTGVTTYTYQVCDTSNPTPVCDSAVVTVVVGPNAADDFAATAQNSTLNASVTANDAFPAGSVFSNTSSPTNGTLTFNADGSYSYVPNAGFSGTDSFTYQVCLPAPNGTVCDTATVTITVGANTVTANDDSSTTPFNTPVTTPVLANDTTTGAALNPASVTVTVASPNGTTSVNPANGEITFTPNATFTGVTQYTYQVCDTSNPTPVCDSAIVTIVVGPNAVEDSFSTPQNTPISDTVTANDAFPMGAVFSNTSSPANGTLLFNPDGTFTYTPNAGFSGSDSFNYQVCLPAPNDTVCDSATVTIGVAVNAISAADDSSTTPFNTPVTTPVLANDTTGGAPLNPASVTVTVASPNGTTSVNPANGEITFTPNATFTGVTQYTYEVCDTSTPTPVCDTAVVTVIVGPNAVDDSFSTPQNTPISDTVTANDAFPMGAVFSNTSSPANGTLLFNADGTFTYTPNAGFSGMDSFTYQVCLPAPNGTACDSATVTIGVAVNAVSAADDSSTTPFNTPVTTNVLANDTTGGAPLNPASVTVTVASPNGTTSVNPANGEITFTPNATFTGVTQYTYQVCDTSTPTPVCDDAVVTVIVGPNAGDDTFTTPQNTALMDTVTANDTFPAGATFANTSTPTNGTLLFNPDGTFTYTPNAGFSGSDSFTYQVCLPAPNGTVCDSATVTITIGANTVTANDDSSTTPFNTPVTTPVLGNDTTTGAALNPASVTVTVVSPNGTTSVNPGNGDITFTPNAGFTGVTTYTYQVCDTSNPTPVCDSAIVTVIVGPNAGDDTFTTPQNTALTDTVTANDTFPTGAVFSNTSSPANGTLLFNPDGTFTYTPNAGFSGSDSFTYQVCLPAPNGTVCDSATVNIGVGANAVTAADDSSTTPFNTPVTTPVLANDTTTGAALNPASVTVTVASPNGTNSVNPANGEITFTPNATFTGVTQYTYQVCDTSNPTPVCDDAIVTIVVGPNAVDDGVTTPQNTPITDTVTANDSFPTGAVFSNTSSPSNGTLLFNADGTFTYTPNAGFSGTDSFTYQVCLPAPNGSVCDSATATIGVGANVVTAADDSSTTPFNTAVTTSVLGNDTTTGAPLDPASVTVTVASPNGTTSVNPGNGDITFTPNAGFTGVTQYTYQVCDTSTPTPVCDDAVVTVIVGPNAGDDTFTTPQNTALTDAVTANDTFPANATFTNTSLPTNGTLLFNADGTFTYTPNAGFSGSDSFTYQVCLPAPNGTVCDSATVNIGVGANAVTAADDSSTTPFNTPVTTPVLANDTTTGAPLDPASVTVTVASSNGTTSVDPVTGEITFTPNATFSGVTQYTYEVCDTSNPTPVCDIAVVTVVVGPDAMDDSASTAQNVPLNSSVTGNDTFPTGAVFSNTSSPANGTLLFNPDGTFTYTPNAGFSGADSFTYQVCLPAPNGTVCDTATVNVGVGVNVIAANDDSSTTAFNTPVTTPVLANDTTGGAPLDPASVTVTVASPNGMTSVNPANGEITFTPNAGFTGVTTYTYQVCDTSNPTPVCDTAVVTVNVGPNAIDDSFSTPQNTPITDTVTANDAFPTGVEFSNTSAPANGTLVFNADGSFTYTPNAGFSGSDGFTYQVCLPAPNGTVCDSATVIITIGANTVTAVDDSSTTPFNTPVTTPVLGNDTTTGAALNPASVTVTVASPNGTTSVNPATGEITFTPNATFTGVTQYTYQVCDTSNPTPVCDDAIVTLVVGPNAVDDAFSTAQNTPITDAVTANDAFPAGAVFSNTSSPANGTLLFNADGSFTYTPNAGFSGTDSFTYQVCLPAPNGAVCDSATVTIGVAVNAISAADDSSTTPFNTPVTTPVLANDTTGGAPLDPASVTVTVASPNGTTSVNPANGEITFTPNAGFTGVTQYTYQVCDTSTPTQVCDTAVVTVIVGPNAVDEGFTTPQNTALSNTVTSNDTFPAGSLFSSTSSPANGTLVFNPDGTFTYTPNAGFSGTDSFTYQVCLPAPNGTVCDSATVNIGVGANAVTAADDSSTTPFNTGVVTNVLGNDTTTGAALNPASVTVTVASPNGTTSVNPATGEITFTPNAGFTGVTTYTYQVCDTSNPTPVCDTAIVTIVVGPNAVDDGFTTPQNTAVNDTVTGNDTFPAGATFANTSTPANGTLLFNADGTFTYTPNAGFSGSDSFTYQVCLPAPNGTVCDGATVTIGIGANVVTAVDDGSTTPFNTPVNTPVLANDTTTGAPLNPASVTVTVASPNGTTSVNPATGEITFTPNAGFTGVTTYTYQVCDSSTPTPVCDTALVTIVVGPNAVDDAFTTPQNTALSDTVTGNDTFPAGATFTSTSLPANGTLVFNADGSFTYTPNTGFSGSDSFTYQVCLPAPNGTVCDSATVTIGIGTNVVVAADDAATTPFGVPVTTAVLANDTTTGAPLDPASVLVTIASPNGTTSVNPATGEITLTPNAGFTGVTSYTYQVCDTSTPTPVCDTAVVTVVVGPNAVDDSASTAQNVPLNSSVTGNDTFPAGATFANTSLPANGTLVFNADGTFTYTPSAGFSGSDSFTYQVCLPAPNATMCDVATVTIGVGVNVVSAVDDASTTPFNTAVTTNVLANDTTGGAPLNPASVTVTVASPNGTTSINPATGEITFTPNAGFTGVTTYTYQVCDTSNPTPVCDSAMVTVVVAPNAVDDAFTTPQNTALNATVTANDAFPAGATFANTSLPANGTLVFNADGTFTYTPNAGFSGSDSFTYQVCLPAPNGTVCDDATVNIGIGANVVAAVDDASTTPFNTAVTTPVLANDTTGGAPLNPASVAVTVPSPNGTTSLDPVTGAITFTPNPGFTGTTTYTYQVCDTSIPTPVCDTAIVTVVVGPNASDDGFTTPQNTALNAAVTANDTFPVGSTFAQLSAPTNGTLVFNADGTFTYTPNPGFSGTDTFTYQVCLPAPNGTMCDGATVTIGIGTNVVTAVDDSSTTPFNTPVTTPVLGNDTTSGAPLNPASVTVTIPSANGTTSVDPVTGAITFTPTPGFTGVASYAYQVCDASTPTPVCDTAVVTVVVGPNAVDDGFTTAQNTPITTTVTGNDAFPAGAVFANTSLPSNGTLVFNADGTFTYTPNAGFSGTDSFTYRVCLPAPNGTICDDATVTIGIGANVVTAVDDAATTPFGTPVAIGVLGNDTTTGAPLNPASVTVTVASPNGTTSVNPVTGEITFTPNAGFTGTTSFTYQVCDTSSPTPVCDTAVVTVVVGPSAVDDASSTPENTPLNASVTGNDTFPAGSSFANTSLPTNGTLVFNADGTYTYTPNPGFSGTDSFTYRVCLPAPNATMCDTATVTITVIADAADLSIVKTLTTPGPYLAGQSVSFDLVVQNAGPNTANNVVVSDVPSNLAITGVAGSGCAALPCTIASLANGASTSITVTATIGADGPFANTATVSADEGDPDPSDNSSTASDVAGPSADVSLVKQLVTAGPYTVGQSVTFTLLVSNAGPSTATDVLVTDTPSNLAITGVSGAGCVALPCTLASLASGANATVTVTATIGAAGPFGNSATATAVEPDPDPIDNTGSDDDVAGDSADVSVVKTLTTVGPYALGQTLSFDILVSNAGPSTATNVQVTDVPTNLNIVSVSGACAALPCTLPSLASGANATITVTATAVAEGMFSNSASANASEPDPDPSDNTGTDSDIAGPSADISVVKTLAGAAPYQVGQTVSFDIAVANAGPSDASNVLVTDTPTNFAVTSVSGAGCSALPCTLPSLAAGTSTTITVTGMPNAAGPFGNSASANASQPDPVPGNNSGSDDDIAGSSANVSVVKTLTTSGPFTIGQSVDFTIVVANAGPSVATNVLVSDVPNNLTLTSVSGAGCSSLPCTLPSLAVGANATILVSGTIGTDGPFGNTAFATAAEPDPDPSDNSGTDSDVAGASADLSVVKTLTTPGPHQVGQSLTYSIVVANAGPSTATNVQITDSPTNLTITGVSGAGCAALPCTLASLASGANATLTVTATVNADGSFANSATATASTPDPVPSNNTDTETGSTQPSADLAILKTVSNPTPDVGSNVTFTIALSNTGPSTANAVSVSDPLPAGYTFVSAVASQGSYVAGSGVWTVGTLADGAGATLDIVATVNASGPYANTATVSSGTPDPDPSDNTSTSTPTPGGSPVASADLSIVKTASNANPTFGGPLTFTLTVTNSGPDAAADVSVVDVLPAGYTFVSASATTGSYQAGNGTWTIGAMASGSTATLMLQVTVGNNGPYANTATVGSSTPDPDPTDNSSTSTPVPVNGQTQADLAVVKTGPAQVSRGEHVAFSIVVRNVGPQTAINARLLDPTPPGLVFVSTTGACTNGFPCPLGDLTNGEQRAVTATYFVPADYIGPDMILNTVTALSDSQDPTPGDSSSSSSVVVRTQQGNVVAPRTIPVDGRWAMLLMAALMALFAAARLRR